MPGEIDYRDLNCWAGNCADAYRTARQELKVEIKSAPALAEKLQNRLDAINIPGAEARVTSFGNYANAWNASFARELTEIVRLPKEAIPASFLQYIVLAIEHRERKVPLSYELAPSMRTSLDTLYVEAKQHFSCVGDAHQGKAVLAGESYAKIFAERSLQAKTHIADVSAEIAASPEQAVEWCKKLAGFSRQEVESGLADLHVSLEAATRDIGALWPGAAQSIKGEALKIIQQTDRFVAEGMPFIKRGNGVNGDISVPVTVNPANIIASSSQAFLLMLASAASSNDVQQDRNFRPVAMAKA